MSMNITRSTSTGLEPAAPRAYRGVGDYAVVRRAVAYIAEHGRAPPEVEAIAHACGVTKDELHHLFRRWAGLAPEAFVAALTLDHARRLLRDCASVLDSAREAGPSAPGRLHDPVITHEAMSPGEWKAGGEGQTFAYGFHASPFGRVLMIATGRGLAGLAFADAGGEAGALDDVRRRWPRARFSEDNALTAPLARRIFDPRRWSRDQPLRIVMIGTDFEVRVWEALLKIPMGRATTYSDIAASIKAPKASRAVGAAVGRNPIAFVVPCHRVIGRGGDLTGYHWGLTRKRTMLAWEAGRARAAGAGRMKRRGEGGEWMLSSSETVCTRAMLRHRDRRAPPPARAGRA
jgi:AraC family transcriptional regulator, regulatory protein of adaptative response / methylated-DNA-[protein]-cysteine methyltransferase